MSKGYVIYNQIAGNGKFNDVLEMLSVIFEEPLEFMEINKIKSYRTFLSSIEKDDFLILCGGDGTLNRFVNETSGIKFTNKLLYFPTGSGNDLAKDLGFQKGSNPFEITPHLKKLPIVTVNNKSFYFINAVGFGIDGYCCEIGDKLRKKTDKDINYTSIAIKALLFHYTPVNAKITVDGKVFTYKNVWIAPTMNGRYYGGGMMPAPMQTRNDKKLSVMVFCGKSRLKTLCIFPSIFKGTHIKHKNNVFIHSGQKITVEFDKPSSLQIDGETILNVTKYSAEIQH